MLSITDAVNACWAVTREKGFDVKQHFKQMLLIGTEVAEAIDALQGTPSPKVMQLLKDFKSVAKRVEKARKDKEEGWQEQSEVLDQENLEEELADICIRVFSYCGGNNIDLEKAIIKKIEFNRTREPMHGKAF